ncbi:hypothetical protein D6783_00760 [Candidatus Woesearchaeota archaeon]|nr:MAG: hypothetical protein D6783_00760 [Candidatus Woesearchaeota archaeon]
MRTGPAPLRAQTATTSQKQQSINTTLRHAKRIMTPTTTKPPTGDSAWRITADDITDLTCAYGGYDAPTRSALFATGLYHCFNANQQIIKPRNTRRVNPFDQTYITGTILTLDNHLNPTRNDHFEAEITHAHVGIDANLDEILVPNSIQGPSLPEGNQELYRLLTQWFKSADVRQLEIATRELFQQTYPGAQFRGYLHTFLHTF